MKMSIEGMTGIYMAYPTSPILESIYRPKNYKTQVNDQHTKIGIAKESFKSRESGYLSNFDNEIKFIPLAIVKNEELVSVEKEILLALKNEFSRVGRAREWFSTSDHNRVASIVSSTLHKTGVKFEHVG